MNSPGWKQIWLWGEVGSRNSFRLEFSEISTSFEDPMFWMYNYENNYLPSYLQILSTAVMNSIHFDGRNVILSLYIFLVLIITFIIENTKRISAFQNLFCRTGECSLNWFAFYSLKNKAITRLLITKELLILDNQGKQLLICRNTKAWSQWSAHLSHWKSLGLSLLHLHFGK